MVQGLLELGVGSFTGQKMHLGFAAPGAKGEGRVVVVDGWRTEAGPQAEQCPSRKLPTT